MDRISAFMDGEADKGEARQAALRLKGNGECCEAWETYHLIGDAMRAEVGSLRGDFGPRFRALLEAEPTVIAPRFAFRRFAPVALSAAASLAAVAVVVSLVFTENPLKPVDQVATVVKPEVAPVKAVSVAAAPRPVLAANQLRVNEYLRAHQEYSPSTALQGVAPYVRTVAATQDNAK